MKIKGTASAEVKKEVKRDEEPVETEETMKV